MFAESCFFGFMLNFQSIECTENQVLLRFLREIKIPIYSTDPPAQLNDDCNRAPCCAAMQSVQPTKRIF